MSSKRRVINHLPSPESNQSPSATTWMKGCPDVSVGTAPGNTEAALMCLDRSGCQAGPVKGSNVEVVSWWLAQISRKRAKRGTDGKGGM